MKSYLESKSRHHQSNFLPAIFPIKETKFEITLIHFPVKFPKRYFHRLWFDVFSAEKNISKLLYRKQNSYKFSFRFSISYLTLKLARLVDMCGPSSHPAAATPTSCTATSVSMQSHIPAKTV